MAGYRDQACRNLVAEIKRLHLCSSLPGVRRLRIAWRRRACPRGLDNVSRNGILASGWLRTFQNPCRHGAFMRRWFLSYNSQDLALVQGVAAALRERDAGAGIFFAPTSLRAGGFWLPELAKEIAEATAFVLLVGEKGLGSWQVMEYYEAIDRRVKEKSFAVVL